MKEGSKIQPFDPYGDPEKTGLKWRDWKRDFNYYLDSKDEMTDRRKFAKLMLLAGRDVQVIYDQEKAKKADEEDSDGEVVSDYVEALQLLDAVFLRQNNMPLQRSIFRTIKQLQDESTAAFVSRLREQAAFCGFGDDEAVEKAIKDQIVSGGRLSEIRRYILKKKRSLSDIIKEAQALENVESFEKLNKRQAETSVNEISAKKARSQQGSAGPSRVRDRNLDETPKGACWACNHEGHRRNDESCPAKGKKCMTCGRKGHFSVVCRSNENQGRRQKPQGRRQVNRVRALEDDEEEEDEGQIEYVFQVGKAKGLVKCCVGGVEIEVLIDSGTRRNLITAEVWQTMKEKRVKTLEMVKGSDISFKAYGQNELIPVVGRFKAVLSLNGKKSEPWFYVVGKGDLCLLGEESSLEHGVLKIVRAVEGEEFAKMKGNSF